MIKWVKGTDFLPYTGKGKNVDNDNPIFGITKQTGEKLTHYNAIELYTSKEDRDLLLTLLNDFEEKRKD